MSAWPLPSESLLREAVGGSASAVGRILESYRPALKQIAAARLDARLAARFDPSDIVQDVLGQASMAMPEWIRSGRPLPACLYRLVHDRLARIWRNHVALQMRSVAREARCYGDFSQSSLFALATRLNPTGDTPSRHAMRHESHDRLRRALAELNQLDRDVVVMRIIEGVPACEVGQILELSEGAVNMRQLRALQRLRKLLAEHS